MNPSKFEGTGRARGCGGGFKTLLSLDLNYLSTPPPKKNIPECLLHLMLCWEDMVPIREMSAPLYKD